MKSVIGRCAKNKKKAGTHIAIEKENKENRSNLSSEQIHEIRGLWDKKTLQEIAGIVGARVEAVSHFAHTHYLFLKYLR